MSIQIKLFTERLSAVSQQYVDYRRVPIQNDVTVPNQPRKNLTQERHFGLTAQVRVCDHRPIAHTDLMNMLIDESRILGSHGVPKRLRNCTTQQVFFQSEGRRRNQSTAGIRNRKPRENSQDRS
jgi:hypothetical protein